MFRQPTIKRYVDRNVGNDEASASGSMDFIGEFEFNRTGRNSFAISERLLLGNPLRFDSKLGR